MPRKAYIPLLCCLLLLTACQGSSTTQTSTVTTTAPAAAAASPQTNNPVAAASEQPQSMPAASQDAAAANSAAQSGKPKLDACSLITNEEINSVQGEPVKETKTDGKIEGGMSISQCFYSVVSFSKSVSLTVTQRDPNNSSGRGPKEFWEETFGRYDEKEGDKDKERERDKGKKAEKEREREKSQGGEEEEESTPPKKISGVGEEAFWMGSRVGGALYALKKNAFIRISVGGPGDENEKINKSKALAQKALKRL